MAQYGIKARIAVFYVDDWLKAQYPDASQSLWDSLHAYSDNAYVEPIKPALRIIEGLSETYKVHGMGSPVHIPQLDKGKEDSDDKSHIHLIWYGQISDDKWNAFAKQLTEKIPQIAFKPKLLNRNEIEAYTKYLTHETEDSKDKQQFTAEQKEVFDCAVEL